MIIKSSGNVQFGNNAVLFMNGDPGSSCENPNLNWLNHMVVLTLWTRGNY